MSLNEKIFKDVSYIFHLAGKGDIVPSIENPLELYDDKCDWNNKGVRKLQKPKN